MTIDLRVIYICTKAMGPVGHIYKDNRPSGHIYICTKVMRPLGHIRWSHRQILDLICRRIINLIERHAYAYAYEYEYEYKVVYDI